MQPEHRDMLRDVMIERVLDAAPHVTYESVWSVVECLVRDDPTVLLQPEHSDEPLDEHGLEALRRARLLYELDDDEAAQAEEMRRVRADPEAFFDDYWWQPNVKEKRVLPFVLFERQRDILHEVVDAYVDQRPLLLKKSREFGLSCELMGIGCHAFVFESHFHLGVASRKQQYLYERKNWHSILEKFLFGLEHLPVWMRPRGWNRDDHVTRNKIMNPENGSLVMGEVGEFIGSGGRASMYVVDEFSLVERQAEAWQSLAGTADCVIAVYTSKGPATYVHQELESNPNIRLVVSPWYWDPRKVDDPKDVGNPDAWSDWAADKLDNVRSYAFELEFCCNDDVPEADGLVSPVWMKASARIEPVANGLAVAGIDLADGGADEHVLYIRRGSYAKCWTWEGIELDDVVPLMIDVMLAENCRLGFFDNLGKGANFPKIVARQPANDLRFIPVSSNADAGLRRLRDKDQPCRNRFADKTTELWWAMMLAIKGAWEKEKDLPIAEGQWLAVTDKRTEQQIMQRKYELQKSGIKLQSKRRMRKSPDRADALSFTFEIDPRTRQTDRAANARQPTANTPGMRNRSPWGGGGSPWS